MSRSASRKKREKLNKAGHGKGSESRPSRVEAYKDNSGKDRRHFLESASARH